MSKKRINSTKWQPIIFNASRLPNTRDEQEWMRDLLANGKAVACPSELNMMVWTRADANLSAKMQALSDVVVRNSWAIGVCDRSHCWKYWRESAQREELEKLLKVFWPGPLLVHELANSSAKEQFGAAFGRKIPLWMPYSSLSTTLLKICDFPLAVGRIRWNQDISPLTSQEIISQYGQGLELIIEGRELPGTMEYTILDVSCPMWRLVRRGHISADIIQRVCSRRILLSGEAADATVGSRTSGVRLVVFEGEAERVVRRMRAFAESQENSESLHYFVHSPCARAAFANEANLNFICGERNAEDIADTLAWQKLGLEVWERICQLDKFQDSVVVLLEGVPRRECTEEFMERLTRVAYQVINLVSLDD